MKCLPFQENHDTPNGVDSAHRNLYTISKKVKQLIFQQKESNEFDRNCAVVISNRNKTLQEVGVSSSFAQGDFSNNVFKTIKVICGDFKIRERVIVGGTVTADSSL